MKCLYCQPDGDQHNPRCAVAWVPMVPSPYTPPATSAAQGPDDWQSGPDGWERLESEVPQYNELIEELLEREKFEADLKFVQEGLQALKEDLPLRASGGEKVVVGGKRTPKVQEVSSERLQEEVENSFRLPGTGGTGAAEDNLGTQSPEVIKQYRSDPINSWVLEPTRRYLTRCDDCRRLRLWGDYFETYRPISPGRGSWWWECERCLLKSITRVVEGDRDVS